MREPRILLIGGPPGAGKTTLGRAVADNLGISTLTVDDLTSAIGAVTSRDTHPEFHQMRGTGPGRYFEESAPDRLVSDALALESAIWPAVERVIRRHASEGLSVVMDWWLLAPRRVSELNLDGVAAVWLHAAADVLTARELINADYFSQGHDSDGMRANFMHRSLWANDHYASEARTFGFPVIHQPGDRSVEDQVEEVLAVTGLGSGPS